jgi:ATP-dependent Lon protease
MRAFDATPGGSDDRPRIRAHRRQHRTIVVGSASLGGSIEIVPNALHVAELAIEKQAQTLLMPVSARRQLNDLPDELWTKISIEFYKDPADAVFKALVE